MPPLAAAMPAAYEMKIAQDRSRRSAPRCTRRRLTLAAQRSARRLIVFLFLAGCAGDLIAPSVVPVSIIGAFGAMYLLGYSLDILSLMALTIATGFVVDDAIVVVENISRRMEAA